MEKKILSYLLGKRINFWKMASRIGYMPDLVLALKKMEKEGLVEIKNTCLSLTPKGRKTASSLKIISQPLPPSDICEAKIDRELLGDYKKLRNKLFEKDELDQLQITSEGVIKKIGIMEKLDDLKDKKIVCMGDDDLVGIALALTGKPKEITVLDIDREVIDYENSVFKKLGYKKSAFRCNFLDPIPKKFGGKYDVFITEPPDTVKGISLFVSRGMECLGKKGGIGYLGACRNDLSDKDFFEIEKNIIKMGG